MKQVVDKILKHYEGDKSYLVSILQDIQGEYNYLPREPLVAVSQKLDIPLSHVYRVATFYRAFSLKPRGKHIINLCMGTACHVRGAPKILEKLERDLGIKAGETTKDKQFTIKTVNCLGACALGPVMVVDGEYHGQVTQSKVDTILKNVKTKKG